MREGGRGGGGGGGGKREGERGRRERERRERERERRGREGGREVQREGEGNRTGLKAGTSTVNEGYQSAQCNCCTGINGHGIGIVAAEPSACRHRGSKDDGAFKTTRKDELPRV